MEDLRPYEPWSKRGGIAVSGYSIPHFQGKVKQSKPNDRHSHRRNHNTMRHEHIRYADSGPQGVNETMVL